MCYNTRPHGGGVGQCLPAALLDLIVVYFTDSRGLLFCFWWLFLVCFEFSGDYSPVQEDAQIHLWEASAGVQAGVFRQTSKWRNTSCPLRALVVWPPLVFTERRSSEGSSRYNPDKLVRCCVSYAEPSPNTSCNPVFLKGHRVPAGMKPSEENIVIRELISRSLAR